MPTFLQGSAFLRREGKYNASPIFKKFSWLYDDTEFISFEERVWNTHLASQHDVDVQQATLDGILQAVLVTQHASVEARAKMEEVTSKLDEVATTTTTSAVDIAECKREIQALKKELHDLQLLSVHSRVSIGPGETAGSFVRNLNILLMLT